MPYLYFSDEEHLAEWMRVEKDPDEFAKFLDKHIYGVESFAEYLELCGGAKRLEELRKIEMVED